MVHLIDGPGSTAPGLFQVGNPFTQVEGTVLTAEWLNMLQAELYWVVVNAGFAPTKGNDQQLSAAISSIVTTTLDFLAGRTWNTLAPYDIADPGIPGAVAGVLVGNAGFGATASYVLAGQNCQVETLGVFALPRLTSETWNRGDRVFWDDVNKRVTTTSASGLYPVGFVFIASGPGLGYGWTRLDGVGTAALP